jgi:hypothetical protein
MPRRASNSINLRLSAAVARDTAHPQPLGIRQLRSWQILGALANFRNSVQICRTTVDYHGL